MSDFLMECKQVKYTASFIAPCAVSQLFHPWLSSRKRKSKLVNLLERDYLSNSAQVEYINIKLLLAPQVEFPVQHRFTSKHYETEFEK